MQYMYMYIHILFVCNEVLKGGIQGYSLCFIANQPMLQRVNLRALLLGQNFSKNYSRFEVGLKLQLNCDFGGKHGPRFGLTLHTRFKVTKCEFSVFTVRLFMKSTHI